MTRTGEGDDPLARWMGEYDAARRRANRTGDTWLGAAPDRQEGGDLARGQVVDGQLDTPVLRREKRRAVAFVGWSRVVEW